MNLLLTCVGKYVSFRAFYANRCCNRLPIPCQISPYDSPPCLLPSRVSLFISITYFLTSYVLLLISITLSTAAIVGVVVRATFKNQVVHSILPHCKAYRYNYSSSLRRIEPSTMALETDITEIKSYIQASSQNSKNQSSLSPSVSVVDNVTFGASLSAALMKNAEVLQP